MPTVQLIYASSVSKDLTVMEIKELVNEAQRDNVGFGITGFLCANSQYFLQCIEGESRAVNVLFQKISKDVRHHSVAIIKYSEIEVIQFSDWSMGAVLDIDKHMDVVTQFSPDGVFNPYLLSGDDNLNFILAFSQIRRG
ncbi:hypothetical protein GCM10007978_01160 [Shewanella hanedai]|jgi:transcription termination factor NusB|uniref:BLUF domain-containing protein n=1 Tax=Shewanella hanedai TaxID=25 RepID=A0A553JUV7_SHEHA|nr:BLUF domain-containing protein [Shewanella hanedai]TRY16231.1 BLUF domain-containing protein [Shewanella hanedai]GGI67286.1 hypothetical protein GCM10007978_01160 [Shewanella hanedai]